MNGREPDLDFWEPTLEGLLVSSSAGFASFWIEQVLQLLRKKAEREGAFPRYVWSELRAEACAAGRSCTDDELMGVALVIRVAGLERTGSKAPPPDYWYWTRPEQFEELLEVHTVQQLLTLRREVAFPFADATTLKPTRAALLAVERGVARAAAGSEVSEAVAAALDDVASALPEPFAMQGKGIASTLKSSEVSHERKKIALLSAAEWARRVHRDNRLRKGEQVSDTDFRAFLEALLTLDGDLPPGVTISIEQAGRKARLTGDVLDRCAARVLDEGLGYVSDVDGQPYALQINQDEVREELDRLPRGQSNSSVGQEIGDELADIAIITIRDDEFEAVLDAFPESAAPSLFVGTASKRHYNLRVADAGEGKQYRIAVVRQTEQGTGEGQALARDCVEDMRPLLVLVVGIAGAPPSNDLTLGDVVLSLRVHDYTVHANTAESTTEYSIGGGPVSDSIAKGVANLRARKAELGEWWAGLPPRPGVAYADEANYAGSDDWKQRVRKSLEFHFKRRARLVPSFIGGDLASSDALVKDPSVLISWLATARNLRAVEMESCGVYRGTRDRTPMLAIRGISDIVGFKRDDDWTAYACRSAAQMARAYLRTKPVEPRGNPTVARGSGSGARQSSSKQWKASALSPGQSAADQTSDSGRVVWKLMLEPPDFGGTKTELYSALTEAVMTYDLRNAKRRARWPRLLVMPETVRSTDADGTTLWAHSYAREENCPRGTEQLRLRPRGQIMFQRSSFSDASGPVAVDFGDMAFDVVLFVAFASRYAWRLGLSGHVDARISLSAVHGARAVFQGALAPTETGTASLTASVVEGTARISTQDYASRTMLIDVALRLLDRVANEFTVGSSPVGPNGHFLSVARASLEALVSSLLGPPPGTEFALSVPAP